MRQRPGTPRHISAGREPAERHRAPRDQHQAEPEARDRNTDHRNDAREVVDRPSLVQRRDHPERDRDDEREHESEQDELEGDRKRIGDLARDRRVIDDGLAEIAPRRAADPCCSIAARAAGPARDRDRTRATSASEASMPSTTRAGDTGMVCTSTNKTMLTTSRTTNRPAIRPPMAHIQASPDQPNWISRVQIVRPVFGLKFLISAATHSTRRRSQARCSGSPPRGSPGSSCRSDRAARRPDTCSSP